MVQKEMKSRTKSPMKVMVLEARPSFFWSTFIGGGVFSPAWVVLSAFQYPGTI